MELDTIQSLISNMGFPIACVVAMFTMLNKEREEHKQESDKWTEAINNNTRVLEKLIFRLDGEKKNDEH